MAAKVHPNTAAVVVAPDEEPAVATAGTVQSSPPPTVLTVWRKSLLFNCAGFTVFDARGDLAFRVDCYGSASSRSRREVVLMDAAGAPLLTVRRSTRLRCLLALSRSSRQRWAIYDGDATDAKPPPLISVRRGGRGGNKTLARVTTPGAEAAAAPEPAYVVEGSYGQRACAVRDARGEKKVVAEVQRKESVGDDVFRLVVADPRLGAPLAMGLVIALDQMFGC